MIDVDIAEPALMCGDNDIRHRPEWMIGRQRLLVEYVKRRPSNAPLGERLDQRRLVNDPAARQIDEIARRFHRCNYSASVLFRVAVVSGVNKIRKSKSPMTRASSSRRCIQSNPASLRGAEVTPTTRMDVCAQFHLARCRRVG